MAKKQHVRNVEAQRAPEVSVSGLHVIIKTGTWSGGDRSTVYNVHGELSMHCACRLVKELRKAMREIRREQVTSLDYCINEAEKPL